MSNEVNLNQMLQFGKHIGKTLEQVLNLDPQYIIWSSEFYKYHPVVVDAANWKVYLRKKEAKRKYDEYMDAYMGYPYHNE